MTETITKASKKHKLNAALGQYFTSDVLVNKAIGLIENGKRILEPSSGNGAFIDKLNKIGDNNVYIELDKNLITHDNVINMDFFDYSTTEKFDTIIGNPPYVDAKTLRKNGFFPPFGSIFRAQTNLFLYFIEKCFAHLENDGELIFIVPRNFITTTSAGPLNNKLLENGALTHFYDFGDEKHFEGTSVNVCLFRYVKNAEQKRVITNNGKFYCHLNNGIISFSKTKIMTATLNEYFDIKVGAVAGAPEFKQETGSEFVYSGTRATGKTTKWIYEKEDPLLLPFKEKLSNRAGLPKNAKWWAWVRKTNFEEDRDRIYVNAKTRNDKPFFIHDCRKWDGAILALFPKKEVDLTRAVEILNNVDWESKGLKSGGRFLFGQKSLSNVGIEEISDLFKDL